MKSDFDVSKSAVCFSNELQTVGKQCVQNGVFVLPKEALYVGEAAFAGLDNLETLVVHENLCYFHPHAFRGCKNLTAVKGLENARNMTMLFSFEGCSKLREIQLPENVSIISAKAFAGCTSLKSLIIPAAVKMIGSNAFEGCNKLELAFLGDKNIDIQSGALDAVKRVYVRHANVVESIVQSGFSGEIAYWDAALNRAVGLDVRTVRDLQDYFSNFLIPAGGSTTWRKFVKDNNASEQIARATIVCGIEIQEDCYIDLLDVVSSSHTMNEEGKEEKLFTALVFRKYSMSKGAGKLAKFDKKETVIYYPYGTDFDRKMLCEICGALNGLIDLARDTPSFAKESLRAIQTKQKQLLRLLLKGTTIQMLWKKS